jgi:glycosyltransferase involved in cell wall biosynthesis
MLNGEKIVVVMPAYNAARTLRQTYEEVMAHGIVDHVIVVDDASHDDTVAIARTLDACRWRCIRRPSTARIRRPVTARACAGADIIIMIHPDYRTPALIPAMAALVERFVRACLADFGRQRTARRHAPVEAVANRFLTFVEISSWAKLSEYHTGYRAFSRSLLERLPLETNSNDFVFDNQVLAQVIALGCPIGEVTCPARYLPEASSINFRRSVRYGFGCLATALRFRFAHRD